MATCGHEDVSGLNVAVDNAGTVRRFEGFRDMDTKFDEARFRDRFPSYVACESDPVEQFHHDEGLAFELVNLVDCANARMI